MSLITPLSEDHLDDNWYSRLVELSGIASEIYTILGPGPAQLQEAEAAFIQSGFAENPNLLPQNSNESNSSLVLQHTKKQLEELLQDIGANEKNVLVKNAYQKRITELKRNLDLLEAARSNDAAAFGRINQAIYGQPNLAVFYATCAWIRPYAERALAKNQDDAAAHKLLGVLPRAPSDVQLLPGTELFNIVKNSHWEENGFYSQLFAGITLPDTATISQREGDAVVAQTLKNIGASDYVIADSPDQFWGVRTATKTIVRPNGYELSVAEFIGIIGHEIGSHILERLNGQRQSLQLLGSGLDRFEAGNEGRALLREQVAYDSPAAFEATTRWQDIVRRHLSISLAVGIDRGVPRSFTETYDILHAVDTVLTEDSSPVIHHRTWTLLSRSLIGTDGTGGAYYKDMVYLEGNIACWNVATRNPALVMYGDYGKFDIARPEHIELLQALEILPQNL
jgi:hypothetical protein